MGADGSGGRLAGVDGCRAGWVAVLGGADPADIEVHVVASFAEVLDLHPALVAVDMPIGLPERRPRTCDREARALLGPRRSSVFPAPARAALLSRHRGWDATLAACRAALGVGLSKQAFGLLARIAELDRLLGADGETVGGVTVVEAHPELAFARLAGGPLPHPKRSPQGRAERAALLQQQITDLSSHLGRRPRGCAADDLLDAAALLGTARRIADGSACFLGDGERDGRGRPMRIGW